VTLNWKSFLNDGPQFLQDCNYKETKIYIQYSCDFNEEEAYQRKVGLHAAFIGLVACFIYSYVIYHTRKSAAINYKIWDMNTVTAADFTVEVGIPPIIWRKWNRRNIKDTQSFKNFFRDQLQRQVDELPPVLDNPATNTNADIACVIFAYSNRKLIKALIKRGKCLIAGKIHNILESEERINHLVSDHRDDFIRPVKAYVSFNTQEGFERATAHCGTSRNIWG